jgi:class 3 adenylate cyclase/tetratricopeptide (TPR) repeat protein/ABC-type transport system involved in cytochrome c biogenesis ATPase subunit
MSSAPPLSLAYRTCHGCSAVEPLRHNFCSQCGTELRATELSSPAPAVTASPASPAYLSERIHNTLRAPDEERKQVTILFADVVGSTALIRRLDPERVAAMLDPALEAMTRAVHAHRGLVSRIQGDGIMALFGAPVADEHHAIKACRAALQMRDDLDSGTQLRIGLHSGEIILRAARSDLIVDYDAVGLAVHIAARVEKNARPGSIYVSATTAQLVSAAFRLQPVGQIRSKGTGRLDAFEVLAERDQSSFWRSRATPGGDRFLGRASELASFARGAAAVQSGSGQVFVVSGPAGAGKSRLVHEMTGPLKQAGWRVEAAAAEPEDELSGYRPIAAMLRRWMGLAKGDTEQAALDKLRIFAAGLDLTAPLAALAALLDLAVSDSTWQNSSPARQRRDIRLAFAEVVRARSQPQPLVLLIEDQHWLGEESRELLSGLINDLSAWRVLLIITSRVASVETWQDLPYVQRLAMEPLPREVCLQLLDNILGPDTSLASVKDHLVSLAHGNPLFVEEFAHNLAATGGIHRVKRDRLNLPATIETILAARIDALPQSLKRIVQTAAAIGTECTTDVLAAALGVAKDRLLVDLASLKAGDFLTCQPSADQETVSFKHILLREVAYGELLDKQRRAIHTAITAAIEELYHTRLEEHVESLARHALGAGLLLKALHHFRQAAARAIARSAFRQADKLIKQALEILFQIFPRDRNVIADEIELRLMQRVSNGALGLYRDCFKTLEKAERLAAELSDPRRLLAVRIAQLHVLGVAKTAQQAKAATSEVVNLALTYGAAAEIASAYFFDCQACWWHGLHRQAVASAQAGLLRLADLPPAAWSGGHGNRQVSLHTQLALNHTCLGEFDDALYHAGQALDIAGANPFDYDTSYAAYGLGWTLTHMGRAATAISALERGLEAADRGEYATNACMLVGVLSWAHLVEGHLDQALALSARALDAPEAMNFLPAWHLFFRALVLHEAGQTGQAEVVLAEVLRRARRKRHRGLVVWARWLVGRMAIERDPAAAIRLLRAAAQTSGQYGLLPLAGRCHDDVVRAALLCRPAAQPPAVSVETVARKIGTATKCNKNVHP